MPNVKELTVDQWRDEIERGLLYRRQTGAEERWEEIEEIFYAHANRATSSGPNLLLSTGDAMMSALTVPFPKYTVRPRTLEDVPRAPVVEAILNGLIEDLRVPEQVQQMCLSAFLCGVGIGKVGYDTEFGFTTKQDPGGTLEPMGLTLTQFDDKGNRIEFGGQGPGMPWFQAVLPHDFLVAYGTHRLDYARWACHRVVRHIDEVKADRKYENTRDLRPCMSLEDYANSYKGRAPLLHYRMGRNASNRTSGVAAEYVELWEIHDRATGKLYVIATGHNEFLRNEEDAMQLGGKLPFIDLAFTLRHRSFWTTPDAAYLLPHQAELTDIHLQGDKNRRTNVPKLLAKSDAFEEDQLESMTRADVNPVILVKPGMSLSDAVMPFPQTNNQSLFMDSDWVQRASRQLVGFSANQFGEFDRSSRRSATEASIVAEASNQRMDRRQIAMRDVYLKLSHFLTELVFTYWTDQKVVPYVGQDGAMQWAKYQGDALKGEYKCSVSFTSEPDLTSNQRKQAATQKAMIMAQLGVPTPQVLAYLLEQLDDHNLSASFRDVIMAMGKQGATNATGQSQMGASVAGQVPQGVPEPQDPNPTRPPQRPGFADQGVR